MQALLPLELCGMWISVGNVWGQVLALPCSLLIEPYIRTMEGACILRKELEGIVSTACVTGYGLNLKVACGIIPDLIVTLKGKTLCFVLASYAAAGNRAQLGEILERWVLRRAEGSCCALRRQGSRVQGPACVQGCKRKCQPAVGNTDASTCPYRVQAMSTRFILRSNAILPSSLSLDPDVMDACAR